MHSIRSQAEVVTSFRSCNPVARPRLPRAYGLPGNPAKARAAYQDFLILWKDADPDIPILQQAKAEYVKLQ